MVHLGLTALLAATAAWVFLRGGHRRAATLVLGVLTGIAARRHRWIILVVYAGFGTLGGLAASVNATATAGMAALTAALAVVAGAGSLWGMLRLISPAGAEPSVGRVQIIA